MAARPLHLPRLRVASARPPGIPLRTIAAVVAAAAVLVGGWLWLRDSPLVSVDRVTVTGVHGEQAAAIDAAVRNAARDMTTLHVRPDVLKKAVAPYPIVRDVTASADFPHRLEVTVHQYVPVGLIVAGGTKVPVAGDGTLLRGALASKVPVVPLDSPPAGDMVGDGPARSAVALLAAAPAPLRARVAKVFVGPRGLTARLRTGTALYFGSGDRLAAKWAAATAVIADPSAKGATSIDLRVPERPAAGGLEQIATQEPAGVTPNTTTTATAPATMAPAGTVTTPITTATTP